MELKQLDRTHFVLHLTADDLLLGYRPSPPTNSNPPGVMVGCSGFVPFANGLSSFPAQELRATVPDSCGASGVGFVDMIPGFVTGQVLQGLYDTTGCIVASLTNTTINVRSLNDASSHALPALYSVGTVTGNVGSTDLVGNGTSWLHQATNTYTPASSGVCYVRIPGLATQYYKVYSVNSDTSITLASALSGSVSSAPYSLYMALSVGSGILGSTYQFVGKYRPYVFGSGPQTCGVVSYGQYYPALQLVYTTNEFTVDSLYGAFGTTVTDPFYGVNDCIEFNGQLLYLAPANMLTGLTSFGTVGYTDSLSLSISGGASGSINVVPDGICFCCERFGEDVLIYTDRGVYQCRRTGTVPPFEMNFYTDLPVFSRFTVCAIPGGNFVLSGSGAYIISAESIERVDSDVVSKLFKSTGDLRTARCFYVDTFKSVFVVVGSDEFFVYSLDRKRWFCVSIGTKQLLYAGTLHYNVYETSDSGT